MAKPKWGKKRICQSCGARFYDLNRKDTACPKCGTTLALEKLPKSRRNAAPTDEAKTPAVAPKEAPKAEEADADADADLEDVDLDDEELVEDLDEEGEDADDVEDVEDELIEDASDLGEDEDDMSEVREHVDDAVEDRT